MIRVDTCKDPPTCTDFRSEKTVTLQSLLHQTRDVTRLSLKCRGGPPNYYRCTSNVNFSVLLEYLLPSSPDANRTFEDLFYTVLGTYFSISSLLREEGRDSAVKECTETVM